MTTRVSGTVTKLLAAFKKLGGLLKSLKALFAKGAAAIKKMLRGRRSPGAQAHSPEPVRYKQTGGSIDREPSSDIRKELWGEEQYERIRASQSDVKMILENNSQLVLGDGHRIVEQDLQKIKDHIF